MADQFEITIEDIAQAAGVSVSTVSRILNNKPDVAETTRQRVQQVIETFGYAPHAQAQRLAAGRSRTIALFYPLEYTAFTHQELDFIVSAAAAAGEENYFFNLMTAPVSKTGLLNIYRSAQVEGVILMQIAMQDWRVELLQERNYPFAMIGRRADNTGLTFIDLDFEVGMDLMVEHLVALGHRHIGFFNNSAAMLQKKFGPAIRFLTGYEQARQKYGLTTAYCEVESTVQAVYEATLHAVAEQPKLTAIVTLQGSTAVGIIRALRTLNREVPEDFSVVAIATEKIAQLITPPLTAVNLPTDVMGYQAAKLIIAQLKQQPVEANQILLPPELVIRGSTGPAPA